jgi:hypothetical protein
MKGMIDFAMSNEDWFNQGKEDAWSGRSKQPPIDDPVAASLYDLGYSEGTYRKPPSKAQPFHHD